MSDMNSICVYFCLSVITKNWQLDADRFEPCNSESPIPLTYHLAISSPICLCLVYRLALNVLSLQCCQGGCVLVSGHESLGTGGHCQATTTKTEGCQA